MLRSALTVLAIGFLGTAEGRTDDAVQNERAKMKGTWRIVSFEINGKKPLTDEQLEKFQLVIDAEGTFTAQFDGKVVNESTTKIDPTKTPKTLDYSFTKGPVKGMPSLAIYELKDDTLTISASEPGKDRPTELSSKDSTLVVYKRKKASTTQAQQGDAKDTGNPVQSEMRVLEGLVGTWKSENVLKTAPATPTPTTSPNVGKNTLILGGHFIENKNYNNEGALLNINIFSYDAKDKVYRQWLFDSNGNTLESTGTWNADTRTLTFTKEQGGNKGVLTMRFVDDNTVHTNIVWKDAAGRVTFDFEGKATRQK